MYKCSVVSQLVAIAISYVNSSSWDAPAKYRQKSKKINSEHNTQNNSSTFTIEFNHYCQSNQRTKRLKNQSSHQMTQISIVSTFDDEKYRLKVSQYMITECLSPLEKERFINVLNVCAEQSGVQNSSKNSNCFEI